MAAALIAIQSWISDRTRSDRGASLVEYALLIVLIAVICAVAVGVLGKSASSSFSATGSGFTAN